MLDFVKFAQKHGIAVLSGGGHHHSSTGWIQTHCPFCTDGKHGFHLGFNPERGNFNCWRCGRIKVFDFIKARLKISDGVVLRVLNQFQIRSQNIAKKQKTRRRSVPVPPRKGTLRAPHWDYLRFRQFDRKDVTQWEVQATSYLSGKWNWRLVYPIRNQTDEIVAWQGRSIADNVQPKYRLTDDADCLEDPKTFLYGIHLALEDYVFVVEGALDVWRMGPGAVALLGSNWYVEQANILRQFKRRFIMLDSNDPLAQKKAHKLAEWLSVFPGETDLILEMDTDPAGLSRLEAQKLKKKLVG